MRELAINEIEMVGGAALNPDTGVNLIGAIGGVAFLVAGQERGQV
jgi:hypothetical protein